jgi:hypothetical protein
VRIGPLDALRLSELRPELLYSTGLDGSGVDHHRVAAAAFFPDGSLVVADEGSSELLFFSENGKLVRQVGGHGDGPGQFRRIEASIAVGADGKLFVFDRQSQRITLFNKEADVVGTYRIDLGGRYLPLLPVARLETGYSVAILEARPLVDLPAGVHRREVQLVLFDEAGVLVDTLGAWRGKEFGAAAGVDEWLVVGFARSAVFGGASNFAVIASTDSVDVSLYRGTDALLNISGEHPIVNIGSRDQEAWTERYISSWPEPARPRLVRTSKLWPMRETYPALGGVVVDSQGQIWIGEYPRINSTHRAWYVFAPDGRPVGKMELPVYWPEPLEVENTVPGFALHELLAAAPDRIAVLMKDQLGVQSVHVFGIGGI